MPVPHDPAKGRGVEVWVDGDAVFVKYSVWMYGFLGTKQIPVSNITAINWKEPGGWTVGFLEIAIMGEQPPPAYSSPNVLNQNRLAFEHEARDKFAAIKDWIQARMGRPMAASSPSAADEIAKLGTLLNEGLITREEFDAHKARLLS